MIHIIIQLIIAYIPHILKKDRFDFNERCNLNVPDGTLIGTADITFVYTNLSKKLVKKAKSIIITVMQIIFKSYADLVLYSL